MCNCNLPSRILKVNAKCSDMCFVQLDGEEHVGYVPDDLGIGGGDYVNFEVCLNCGKIQGDFPKTKTLKPEGEE